MGMAASKKKKKKTSSKATASAATAEAEPTNGQKGGDNETTIIDEGLDSDEGEPDTEQATVTLTKADYDKLFAAAKKNMSNNELKNSNMKVKHFQDKLNRLVKGLPNWRGASSKITIVSKVDEAAARLKIHTLFDPDIALDTFNKDQQEMLQLRGEELGEVQEYALETLFGPTSPVSTSVADTVMNYAKEREMNLGQAWNYFKTTYVTAIAKEQAEKLRGMSNNSAELVAEMRSDKGKVITVAVVKEAINNYCAALRRSNELAGIERVMTTSDQNFLTRQVYTHFYRSIVGSIPGYKDMHYDDVYAAMLEKESYLPKNRDKVEHALQVRDTKFQKNKRVKWNQQPRTMRSLQPRTMRSQQPRAMRRSQNPGTGQKRRGGDCYHWTASEGFCKYGDTCKFSHNPDLHKNAAFNRRKIKKASTGSSFIKRERTYTAVEEPKKPTPERMFAVRTPTRKDNDSSGPPSLQAQNAKSFLETAGGSTERKYGN